MNDFLKVTTSFVSVVVLAFAGGFWWFYGGGEELIFRRSARFSCTTTADPSNSNRDVWTVNYHKRGNADSQPWLRMVREMGDGWNTTKRCDELAMRLNHFAADGLVQIDYRPDEAVPNQYILCGVTKRTPEACELLLTLAVGDDPEATIQQLTQGLKTGESTEQNTGGDEFDASSWTINVSGLL